MSQPRSASKRDLFKAMEDAILETNGALPSATRREVRDRARATALLSEGRRREDPTSALIEQVALRSHQTTDAHIDAAREAMDGEDPLLEVILSAALGASQARLERGLAALDALRLAGQANSQAHSQAHSDEEGTR